MDYSLPGSSVHGIFQARILTWVAIPFSRDRTWVSHIAGRFFTVWITREAPRLNEWSTNINNLHLNLPHPWFCKYFPGTQPHLFVRVLPTADCLLHRHHWIVVKVTMWPMSLKYLLFGLLQKSLLTPELAYNTGFLQLKPFFFFLWKHVRNPALIIFEIQLLSSSNSCFLFLLTFWTITQYFSCGVYL